jgi:hypothetical protein
MLCAALLAVTRFRMKRICIYYWLCSVLVKLGTDIKVNSLCGLPARTALVYQTFRVHFCCMCTWIVSLSTV